MQIPQQLQSFSKPTLIVVGGFERAKIYMAHEDTLEEMESFEAPLPKKPPEGQKTGGGGRVMNPSADPDQGVRREKLATAIVEFLTTALRDGEADTVQLVMPTEECRRVSNDLPNDLKGKIEKTLEVDLIKVPIVQVLERLAK